jgi:hypothetical protein
LREGAEVIATLTVVDDDFPWLHARVDATARFEVYRPLFDEELNAINEPGEDERAAMQRANRAYEAIRSATTLHHPGGRVVPEWLLHIEGDHAWWRWHDEPFDVSPAENA